VTLGGYFEMVSVAVCCDLYDVWLVWVGLCVGMCWLILVGEEFIFLGDSGRCGENGSLRGLGVSGWSGVGFVGVGLGGCFFGCVGVLCVVVRDRFVGVVCVCGFGLFYGLSWFFVFLLVVWGVGVVFWGLFVFVVCWGCCCGCLLLLWVVGVCLFGVGWFLVFLFCLSLVVWRCFGFCVGVFGVVVGGGGGLCLGVGVGGLWFCWAGLWVG
jgi:hypothetical protein